MDSCLDALDARFEGMDTWIIQLEDNMGFIHRCFCNDPPRRYGIHTLIFDNFNFFSFIKRTPLIFAYENRCDFVTT